MGNALDVCCYPSHSPSEIDVEGLNSGGTNKVELAASQLFTIPGLASAYHTSVLVNGEEFFFSDSGIFSDRALTSHQGEPSEKTFMGHSKRTGSQLLHALQRHFRPGTYDLIHKNCNSFSDCALHFLLEKRLPSKYNAMEGLGRSAGPDLLKQVTKGAYNPNQAANGFSSDAVVASLKEWVPANDPSVGGAAQSRPALYLGAQVTVTGLKNAPTLNGKGARVTRFNAVNGRWEACLNHSGEIKAFRAENLRPAGELVLQPGDEVRIHGLQSESGQVLNGKTVSVIRYLHDISRYEVDVDGAPKALKADNLQVLPENVS
eukprot:TRINITY_DN41539_c0_g1_i1.p1 TRINITY_DN41539_c0_g1~~TRINITY_DN41539_c0_g1_i1.p1  ORF type:complete len:318 (-),score=41.16 TRINITY_DN41539_c0_g1_i1:509-1462(-)